MEFLLSIVDNNAILLSSNSDIVHMCSTDYEPGNITEFELTRKINSLLTNTVSINEYLRGVYILGTNDTFFSSYWDINDTQVRTWLNFKSNHDIEIVFSDKKNIRGIYIPQFERNIISFIKPIFKFPEAKLIGVLVIDINYIYLREIFTQSSLTDNDQQKTFIVNSKNETLFTFPYNTNMDFMKKDHPELFSGGLHREVINFFGKESLVISELFRQNDWRIVRVTFLDKLNNNIKTIFVTLMLFLLFMMIVYLLLSLVISDSISKPIIELNKKLKQFQTGDFNVKIESSRSDEIGQLNNTFNHMTKRIENLLNKSVEEEKRKSNLEFEVLQAQINPHFLYNTLDSIKWLSVIQGVENIGEMTTALINLLKYNMSHTSRLVDIEEEIESVKNYIQIQKFRYGEIVSIQYNIPDEILKMKMLKFLLQPVVENAIFHGLEEVEEEGLIIIESYVQDDKYIIFNIIDNGSGFVFDDKGNIKKDKSSGRGLHSGIGTKNIEERINLFFGSDYGISFSNTKDGGGKVTLRLPKILSEKED